MQQAPSLSLVILALIDATSIGTLVIPIWLLLRGDYRKAVPRVLGYLGMLAGFYWLIGLGLRSGWELTSSLLPAGLFQSPAVRLLMFLLGAGMIIWALSYRTEEQKLARARKLAASTPAGAPPVEPAETPTGVSAGLQARMGRALDSWTGVLVLALIAGLLELPTMLPYLGALSIIGAAGWGATLQILVLAGYCLVMILPGLVLAMVRSMAGAKLDAWLQRVGRKLGKYAQETLAWVVGIAGYLIIRAALGQMELGEFFEHVFPG